MGVLYDALVGLSANRDDVLLDAYRRYETELVTILTAEQLATYAETIRRSGKLRIVEEMRPGEVAGLTPDESAIAEVIKASEKSSMENRRVAALLNQRGEQAIAPDLNGAGRSQVDASKRGDMPKR